MLYDIIKKWWGRKNRRFGIGSCGVLDILAWVIDGFCCYLFIYLGGFLVGRLGTGGLPMVDSDYW